MGHLLMRKNSNVQQLKLKLDDMGGENVSDGELFEASPYNKRKGGDDDHKHGNCDMMMMKALMVSQNNLVSGFKIQTGKMCEQVENLDKAVKAIDSRTVSLAVKLSDSLLKQGSKDLLVKELGNTWARR